MKNRKHLNLRKVKHAPAFIKAAGGLAVIYISLRVLARLLLGRRRRDNILQDLHLANFHAFLKFLHLPPIRHEPIVSSFIEKKEGDIFVDVGAGLGYYSFLLHDNFNNILAIEPHPQKVERIKRVKELYGYDKVAILEAAISDKNGEERLYFGPSRGMHSLVYNHKHGYSTVKTITLDSLLQGYDEIDLVKVDVEGAEWKVLNGTKNVMDKIKSWVIELHDLKRAKKLEDLMKSHGYNVKWIDWCRMHAWRSEGEE